MLSLRRLNPELKLNKKKKKRLLILVFFQGEDTIKMIHLARSFRINIFS